MISRPNDNSLRLYRALTTLVAPVLPLWLLLRQARGKEDRLRLRERFGYASKPRPKGTLLWLHAASVGEANSVLLLIGTIRERFPHLQLLLTTGTVTSAKLMQARLPKEVIHQYAPVDTPQAAQRFIRHWQPDIALWVESELWPNLVAETRASHAFMGILNARMSERSYRRWRKHPALIRDMLGAFNCLFPQSEADGLRLKALGAKNVTYLGNLKYDAALLPCDEGELVRLKNAIGARPVWLAASTHPGEETLIAQTHASIAAKYPALLTIIVPRHPERGDAIAQTMPAFQKAQRAKQQPVTPATQIYIADTLGELGLFYRLSEIVFMGGSLVRHGGQNPLEPARLACAILTGPHTHNFNDMYKDMERSGGCLRVKNQQALGAQVAMLLGDHAALEQLQTQAKIWLDTKTGAAERLLAMLAPVLAMKAEAV